MTKKNNNNKEHGNISLQRQVSHSANVDFRPFRLEYLELESPFDASSILLDF
jgi:hypothetical protein